MMNVYKQYAGTLLFGVLMAACSAESDQVPTEDGAAKEDATALAVDAATEIYSQQLGETTHLRVLQGDSGEFMVGIVGDVRTDRTFIEKGLASIRQVGLERTLTVWNGGAGSIPTSLIDIDRELIGSRPVDTAYEVPMPESDAATRTRRYADNQWEWFQDNFCSPDPDFQALRYCQRLVTGSQNSIEDWDTVYTSNGSDTNTLVNKFSKYNSSQRKWITWFTETLPALGLTGWIVHFSAEISGRHTTSSGSQAVSALYDI